MLQEQRHVEVEIDRLGRGCRRARRRRSMDEQQKRLTTLMENYSSGRITDVLTFLRSVGHAFARYNTELGVELVEADQSVPSTSVLTGGTVPSAITASDDDSDVLPDLPSISVATATINATPRRRSTRQLRNRSRATATSTVHQAPTTRAASIPPTAVANVPVERVSTAMDCPVCLSCICDSVILPCAHCACVSCINRLMTQTPRGSGVRCPVCRGEMSNFVNLIFTAST